jgi:hypothetical protein
MWFFLFVGLLPKIGASPVPEPNYYFFIGILISYLIEVREAHPEAW